MVYGGFHCSKDDVSSDVCKIQLIQKIGDGAAMLAPQVQLSVDVQARSLDSCVDRWIPKDVRHGNLDWRHQSNHFPGSFISRQQEATRQTDMCRAFK